MDEPGDQACDVDSEEDDARPRPPWGLSGDETVERAHVERREEDKTDKPLDGSTDEVAGWGNRSTSGFVLPSNRRGPGVGAGRGRMPDQVEDVHHALPYGLALESLVDWHRLSECRRACARRLALAERHHLG